MIDCSELIEILKRWARQMTKTGIFRAIEPLALAWSGAHGFVKSTTNLV